MTQYICTLSQETQRAILRALKDSGAECIGEAINGRLCGLEDIIDISQFKEDEQ